MTRIWPVTRFVLLLAVGYLAVEGGGGYATVAVLAWWLAYWGLRDDLRWECAGNRFSLMGYTAAKFDVGDTLILNKHTHREQVVVVNDIVDSATIGVRTPGRWVR